MTVRIVDLDTTWFENERYGPRVPAQGNPLWFLLDGRFRPVTQVPTERPEEPQAGREKVHQAFEETYRHWSLPRCEATERSLARLREPDTALVVTGQQPGFLGGPLYTLFKALTAVATARKYSETTRRTCAPVFWVAGEDHDLDEIRAAHFPAGAGEEVTFSYAAAMDRRPVADYPMDDTNLRLLEALQSRLANRRFGELASAMANLYRGRGLAAGFAALMSKLLGNTGLLMIDPVRLRPLARPLWRRVIEAPGKILESIARGREEVEEAGLKPFVGDRLPFFLVIDGQRHHLQTHVDGFQVDGGGLHFRRQELLELLAEDPYAFSPGALLRPLVQQFTLPCVLTIGGPAEVGYFAQLPPLASTLGLAPPRIGLRLGATLLDGQAAKISRGYTPLELSRAGSPEELVLMRATPGEFDAIDDLAQHAEETLQRVVEDLPASTANLKRLSSRARTIPKDIRGLGERIAKSWAQSREVELGRARKLWNQLFPAGVFQERRWNALHFVSKHGTEWIGELLEFLIEDPLKICHRFITFEKKDKGQATRDQRSEIREDF